MSQHTQYLYWVIEHRWIGDIRHGPFKWRRLAEEFAVKIAGTHRPISIKVEIEEPTPSPATTAGDWRKPA